MKHCPLNKSDANVEACLYIDCDFYKERKCDFPHARGGVLPMADADGAYHYSEEEQTAMFTIRVYRKRSTPVQVMFQMARALIDRAETEFHKYKAPLN